MIYEFFNVKVNESRIEVLIFVKDYHFRFLFLPYLFL